MASNDLDIERRTDRPRHHFQRQAARLGDALRAGGYARVSFVAEVNGVIVGHILFSPPLIATRAGTENVLSPAPMAVLPGSLTGIMGRVEFPSPFQMLTSSTSGMEVLPAFCSSLVANS